MITRRGFLKGMLLAGVAPAIVRADSLMRLIPTETTIIESSGFGLAAIKKEGASVLYDGCTPQNLWPGVKAWWAADYASLSDEVTLVLGYTTEDGIRVVDGTFSGDRAKRLLDQLQDSVTISSSSRFR